MSIFLMACGGPKELAYNEVPEDLDVAVLMDAVPTTVDSAQTFEFTGSANYEADGSDVRFRYTIRMIRDSVIWIDITDPFVGLKVARAIVFPDSAAFYNRFNSEWAAGGMDVVQEKLNLALDFHHMEALLLGEPFLLPAESPAIRLADTASPGHVGLVLAGAPGDSLFQFAPPVYQYEFAFEERLPLTSVLLEDGPRTVRIAYAYSEAERQLPQSVDLKLDWDSSLRVKLQHLQITRNAEIRVPFSIPNGYERIR